MSVTANDLVTGALRKIGIFEATETPPSEDLSHGRTALNEMMADWSLQGLLACDMTFDDGTTSYNFPPGYDRAIRLNLALELAPDYRVAPTPEMRLQAERALTMIKRANWSMTEMELDPALTFGPGSRYDITSDS